MSPEGGDESAAEPLRERHGPEEPQLPRWVPTLIGAVLVTLAALAVYTGVRYHNPTLADGIIRPKRSPTAAAAGPPGEPGPGASLIFPGDSGDNAPTASISRSESSRSLIVTRGMLAASRLLE